MAKEPATILVRVPNPRDTEQFDHYLFWFAHAAGGNTYCCAALYKGEEPGPACESWAYDNFPHSACDAMRYHWKKIRLPSRVAAKREYDLAEKAYTPIREKWRNASDKAYAALDPILKKKAWTTVFMWRKRLEKASERMERAGAMLYPVVR